MLSGMWLAVMDTTTHGRADSMDWWHYGHAIPSGHCPQTLVIQTQIQKYKYKYKYKYKCKYKYKYT